MNKIYELLIFNYGVVTTVRLAATDSTSAIYSSGYSPDTIISLRLIGTEDVDDRTQSS